MARSEGIIQRPAARSTSALRAPATSLRRVKVSIRNWIAKPMAGSSRACPPVSPGFRGREASIATSLITLSPASSNIRSRDVSASGRDSPVTGLTSIRSS
ncbi:hypothetical protein D3C87_1403020 [compost metagenome]